MATIRRGGLNIDRKDEIWWLLNDNQNANFNDRGIIAETVPLLTTNAYTAPVTNRQYLIGLSLRPDDVVQGLQTVGGLVAAATTACQVALYNKSGTRLAVSSSGTSVWAATGFAGLDFTTAASITEFGLYYASFVAAGSGMPSLVAATTISAKGAPRSSSYYGAAGTVASVSSCEATVTVDTGINNIPFYVAAYGVTRSF